MPTAGAVAVISSLAYAVQEQTQGTDSLGDNEAQDGDDGKSLDATSNPNLLAPTMDLDQASLMLGVAIQACNTYLCFATAC